MTAALPLKKYKRRWTGTGWFLALAASSAAAVIAYRFSTITIAPYADFWANFAAPATSFTTGIDADFLGAVRDSIRAVPLIGGALLATAGAVGQLASGGIGLVHFLTANALQIAPWWIKFRPKPLKSAIESVESFGSYDTKNLDPDSIEYRLKKRYNSLPALGFIALLIGQVASYIVDLAVGLSTNPPIEGGYAAWRVVMASPQLSDIAWGEVGHILALMFSTEAIFLAWLLTINVIEIYFARAEKKSRS